jgi:1,2-diacylglycerol 3-beta-galactosyltransferase
MPTVEIVFFDAGGGHRSAALALKEAIALQHRPWDLRLTNLQDILDPLDYLLRSTGVRCQDVYNWSLRRGWTSAASHVVPAMHGMIRLLLPRQVALLRSHWRATAPDLVVSVVPHFNRALFESLRQELPAVKLVTILTDIADYPPHFWFELQDQHYICGSDKATRQARTMGIALSNIWRVSGMIVHPRFYAAARLDRQRERQRLGLKPEVPTGLVLFGGYGSAVMLDIVRRLDQSDIDTQLIVLCGRNRRLASELISLKKRKPCVIQGFTEEVAYHMRLSDYFIGKPGPGSISEALAMRLPVIVERSAHTMIQERFNTEWVEENEVGIVVRSFSKVAAAVRSILSPSRYRRLTARIDRMNNQAVFEVVEILAGLLPNAGPPASADDRRATFGPLEGNEWLIAPDVIS